MRLWARLRLVGLVLLVGLLPSSAAARKRIRLRPSQAVFDMGSNAVRLLVSNKKGKIVFDGKASTQLGQQLPESGALPKKNRRRAVSAIKSLIKHVKAHGVPPKNRALIATGVVRNGGKSGKKLVAKIIREFKIGKHQILPGAKEAILGFRGALVAWPAKRLARVLGRVPGQVMVVDAGGGSHQMTVGDLEAAAEPSSVQVGSHYVRDYVLPSTEQPINAKALARADARLAKLLKQAPVARPKGAPVVLIGGFAKFLRVYFGRDAVTRAEVQKMRLELAQMTVAKRRKHFRKRFVANRKAAKKKGGKLRLSKRAIDKQLASLNLDKNKRWQGRNIIAKATLLLRLMEQLGIEGEQAMLLSPTDARYVVAER